MHITPFAASFGLGAAELMILFIIFCGFPFWIWMIVDCATHESSPGAKVGWIVALALAGVIAAPLYFFARKLPRKKKEPNQAPDPTAPSGRDSA